MSTLDINIPVAARPKASTRRLPLLGFTGWLAVAVLALVFLIALLGPTLVTADPNEVNLGDAYAAPGAGHPLGQDANGRDLLARLVHGSRTALVGPLLVVIASAVLGTTIALTAVWFGGWFDTMVARVVDALFAFPGLLLAILAAALFGAGLTAAVAALTIAYTPYIARIVRSAALRERNLPYVAALRIQGVSGLRICGRHILPNVFTLIIANSALAFGFALIDLAGLSFLGLGVQPPTADWGVMVAEGVPGILLNYPQTAIYPSALIVITVGAANLLGERLTRAAQEKS
ncbi:ABC transporter permease [Nocardioides eburneiflavus]|uniref:ABC transporter permease n=1 Tax=Nocardioides eburneiflavus TaxID=2518372 RepID=A0A4Z1CGV0_9ACTN|nr:ABC transporter permease [Nocardioides eburneiflavus]TGN65755.1 ABC transporter permease [Nocardioides eburneiflavus]